MKQCFDTTHIGAVPKLVQIIGKQVQRLHGSAAVREESFTRATVSEYNRSHSMRWEGVNGSDAQVRKPAYVLFAKLYGTIEANTLSPTHTQYIV